VPGADSPDLLDDEVLVCGAHANHHGVGVDAAELGREIARRGRLDDAGAYLARPGLEAAAPRLVAIGWCGRSPATFR
jgi:hypothetical protein